MSDETKVDVTEEEGAAKAGAVSVTKPEKKPKAAKAEGEQATPKAKRASGEKADSGAGAEKPASSAKKSDAPKAGDGEKAAKKPDLSKGGVAVPRLKVLYKETIAPELFKERGYKSVMQVPKVAKVVVSMGIGEATSNKKLLDAAVTDISTITGQHAVKTKAKKSIANFKLREGNEVGVMVTLRGARMYEFLDRLINVALPRVKDFRGVKASGFDGHGNYSLGITEQIIFPEIDFDKIERIAGMNVNIVTTAQTDADARALLDKFRMPFRK